MSSPGTFRFIERMNGPMLGRICRGIEGSGEGQGQKSSYLFRFISNKGEKGLAINKSRFRIEPL